MQCYGCGMSDVNETALEKEYRLSVCRRCRMFEQKRNPKEVQRLPVELAITDRSREGRPAVDEMTKRVQRKRAAKAAAATPASAGKGGEA